MSWLKRLLGGAPITSSPGSAAAPAGEPVALAATGAMAEPADRLDFVVIDVETASRQPGSICQLGVVGFEDGREAWAFETLVDPRCDFELMNTRVHGISARHVVGRPCFSDLYEELHRRMAGRVAVAHSSFDQRALLAACRASERPTIRSSWIDSLEVARQAWPHLDGHGLGDLAAYLGIAHRHHDAISDARAAGWVMIRAVEQTGLGLSEWVMKPARKSSPKPSVAREPTAGGPLAGHCVCLTGEFSAPKAKLANQIADAGGRVSATVTKACTLVVVGDRDPEVFDGAEKSGKHRRAEELIEQGQALRIVREDELQRMLTSGV